MCIFQTGMQKVRLYTTRGTAMFWAPRPLFHNRRPQRKLRTVKNQFLNEFTFICFNNLGV